MNDEVFFQVRYTVTVGERDDLLRDLAQLRMAESSRAEQGCLQYKGAQQTFVMSHNFRLFTALTGTATAPQKQSKQKD